MVTLGGDGIKTTVERTTEIIGGKEYPLTITRQEGIQEIMIGGKLVAVEELTIFDSPLGQTRCCTRARTEASPEERDAALRRLRETAVRAMEDQGLW